MKLHMGLKIVIAMLVTNSIATSTLAQETSPKTSKYESGQTLYNQRHYEDAVKVFQSAITSEKPELMPSIYYYLGCCYSQLKQTTKARQCFVFVRDHYPQTREAGLAIIAVGTNHSSDSNQSKNTSLTANANNSGFNSAPSRSSSNQSRASERSDLRNLPDENRFYFKPGSNGHMEVQAYLNDRPITCYFDTGASAHFGKNHLREAGIAEPIGPATARVSGWAGNVVPAWLMTCTVKLGNMKRLVPITVEENMDLPPLLGQEFVKGYSYEIDHAAGFVTMKKEVSSQIAENNLYDVPCTKQQNRDIVVVQVNGKSMPIMLDTGASRTIFDPNELAQIGIHVGDDLPATMMQGVGGIITMKEMNLQIRIGPFSSTVEALVGRPDGGSAIGQDVLSGHRFTIDENKHLMRFFH
jgi:predicted aspartyl protease